MKENYFLINGNTYIISYKDFKLDIYRLDNNNRIELSDSEREYMDSIIKRNSSYIYTSRVIDSIIENNTSINSNEYAPRLLEWLESIIPAEVRDDFYHNLETLKIETVEEMIDKDVMAYYSVKENTICMLPIEKYESEDRYAQALLADLIHMAGTKYDKEKDIAVSGFDEIVDDFSKRNRGITEGLSEVLSYTGVQNADPSKSAFIIEELIVDQLSKIVGPRTIIESNFGNKGTSILEEELNSIDNNKEKASGLFRDIEINYYFGSESTEQNVLGNVQDNLIDYFEKKIKKGLMDDTIDITQVPELITDYEQYLITPQRLERLNKNPEAFVGVKESVDRFNNLKSFYGNIIGIDENIETKSNFFGKAGFSNVVLLTLATAVVSLGIVVLGVYLGM